MTDNAGIYIGTILLEKNRWAKGRRPSYKVSQWAQRFVDAGFDGMELWQNHATLCETEEVDAIAEGPCPVAIFNSYATMDDDADGDRERAVELVRRFGAAGVKFNVPKAPGQYDALKGNVLEWGGAMPPGVRMLCECHPNTALEEASDAGRFFSDMPADRWQAIVHPFTRFESLAEWFDVMGPAITHAHIQMTDEQGVFVRLARRDRLVKEVLDIMRGGGFSGSYTLEFAEGVRTESENIDDLFRSAVADLEYLRKVLC